MNLKSFTAIQSSLNSVHIIVFFTEKSYNVIFFLKEKKNKLLFWSIKKSKYFKAFRVIFW